MSRDPMAAWPLKHPPRPVQTEMIESAIEAFDRGARFLLVEGPPGTGKSAVAVTAARHYGQAWIATVTKQLQDQYMEDFEPVGARVLKGRSAFPCAWCGDTCDVGGTLGCPAGKDGGCPYKAHKAGAFLSPLVIGNYHSLLQNAQGPRDVLVLDECHDIEKLFLGLIGVEIYKSSLPFQPKGGIPSKDGLSADEAFAWIRETLAPMIEKELEGLGGLAGRPDVPKELARRAIKVQRLARTIRFAVQHEKTTPWIAEPDAKAGGFGLKPLYIYPFTGWLFHLGTRILMLSATILRPDVVQRNLGVDPAAAAFFRAPCVFPRENRLVHVGALDMRKASRDRSWPIMAEIVLELFQRHANEKGLLLAPSNEMLHYVREKLPKAQADRLLLAYGRERIENYNRHRQSSSPTVLGASGFWEGADLKDDLSRFQIIPALPRPHFSGQVAARVQLDPYHGDEWYRWRTMTTLIQGCGRSVRTERDFSATYVFDAQLRVEARRHDTLLPPWFVEAMIDVPEWSSAGWRGRRLRHPAEAAP